MENVGVHRLVQRLSNGGGDFLPIELLQFGFVIPSIDLGWTANQKEEDDRFGCWGEVGLAGGHGAKRIDIPDPPAGRGCESEILVQESQPGCRAKTTPK